MLALLTGLWAGVKRLGWGLPEPREEFALIHGPLMISGFLGTLICLERAVGSQKAWTYSAPLLCAAGAVLLAAGAPIAAAQVPIVLASLLLAAIVFRPEPPAVVLALGATAWAAGNILWMFDYPLYRVVWYWAAFLVLTIAGERLELARALAHSPAVRFLLAAVLAVFIAGVVFETRAAGAGLVLLAAWLFRYDIARRTVRVPGLTRFIAVCLLAGYAWLAIGGALAAAFGEIVSIQKYDAMIHSVFLGFVMSMIFGHAPIIFPAVLGVSMKFRRTFYVHLTLLHATLALRVAGDLTDGLPGRDWGGLLNAVTILIFLINTATSVTRSTAPPATAPRESP